MAAYADDDQHDQREDDPGPKFRNLEGIGECRDHDRAALEKPVNRGLSTMRPAQGIQR